MKEIGYKKILKYFVHGLGEKKLGGQMHQFKQAPLWSSLILAWITVVSAGNATNLTMEDAPPKPSSVSSNLFLPLPIISSEGIVLENCAQSKNDPGRFETLVKLSLLKGDHADYALKQMVTIAEDGASGQRFLAMAYLWGADVPMHYQQISLNLLRTSAKTYGDKDQFESADHLLTYGDAPDQKIARRSLAWIYHSVPTDRDAAVISLWIHGDQKTHQRFRTYVRSRVMEDHPDSYTYVELLHNYGSDEDRQFVRPIITRFESGCLADEMTEGIDGP